MSKKQQASGHHMVPISCKALYMYCSFLNGLTKLTILMHQKSTILDGDSIFVQCHKVSYLPEYHNDAYKRNHLGSP